MKVNFHQVLRNLEGNPLEDEKLQEVTLGKVAITALMNMHEDERALSGEEKLKRYDLASAIYALEDGAPFEITVEMVALLKNLINKTYGVAVVGPAWRMLEGDKEE